ncbi:flagellin, partial [Polynucleobacter sp. MWH-Berg-3C6]|uniref:flagellin n=1 Tax=Polynucleobacter sp. MWH-Berg-3C6 TaxID=1855882 RepID=UPI001C0C5FA9
LSSGTRINSAKDDAAGYGISESLKGTKNIVDQSIRNTKDAISQIQTAEGALDVVGKMLQRVLTLTTQRQDGTLNSDQTDSINNEIASLLNEIQNVKERTQFQGGSGSVFGTTNALSTGTGAVSEINISDLSLASNTGAYWTGSLGDFENVYLGSDIQNDPTAPDYGVGGARFAPGTFSSPVPVGTHLYYGDGNTKIDSGVTVTD